MPDPGSSHVTALIAAAGSGERLGAGGPKALVALAGRPLIAWCLDAFAAAPSVSHVVIAAPPGMKEGFDRLEAEVVAGGATRAASVANGLEAVTTELVAVHDAARPLVTTQLIEALVERLVERDDAAGVIAATPVTDTVKRVNEVNQIVATEDRARLWAAQTPQVFRTAALRDAHAAGVADATDDAMLVERAGGLVLFEPAPAENIKVTTPADLRLAELLLASR